MENKEHIPQTDKTKFIEILKHCNFYPALAYECRKQKGIIDFTIFLMTIDKSKFIRFSIEWCKTSQGHEYWDSIDLDWGAFCKYADMHGYGSRESFHYLKKYYNPNHDFSNDDILNKVSSAQPVEPSKDFKVILKRPKLNKLNFKL